MARNYMALSRVNAVDFKNWAQSLRDERAAGSSGRNSSLTPRDRLAAEKFDRAWAARYERERKPGWHRAEARMDGQRAVRRALG